MVVDHRLVPIAGRKGKNKKKNKKGSLFATFALLAPTYAQLQGNQQESADGLTALRF